MSCEQNPRLQEYLDGELAAAAESALRRHLAGCAECAAELALFERVFATLDATPLVEPPARLEARILDRVLPSQVRRRWLRAVGWSYGAAAAASAAAAVALMASPMPRAWLGLLGVEASQRLAQTTMFVIDSLALAMVRLSGGWSLVHEFGLRLSPIARVLSTLLSRPGVDLTLLFATVASGVLLVWLRPRDLGRKPARTPREIEHAGLLAL